MSQPFTPQVKFKIYSSKRCIFQGVFGSLESTHRKAEELVLGCYQALMRLVRTMGASQYEVLKCDGCGKMLGYIYIDVRIFPPERLIRLTSGGPLKKIEKTVFCQECFQKRTAETSKQKL